MSDFFRRRCVTTYIVECCRGVHARLAWRANRKTVYHKDNYQAYPIIKFSDFQHTLIPILVFSLGSSGTILYHKLLLIQKKYIQSCNHNKAKCIICALFFCQLKYSWRSSRPKLMIPSPPPIWVPMAVCSPTWEDVLTWTWILGDLSVVYKPLNSYHLWHSSSFKHVMGWVCWSSIKYPWTIFKQQVTHSIWLKIKGHFNICYKSLLIPTKAKCVGPTMCSATCLTTTWKLTPFERSTQVRSTD